MSEYTPTTDEVRYRVEHDWEPYGDGSFDRWLNKVKAEAWHEGHRVGWEHCQDGNYGNDYWDDETRSPYAP